MIFDKIAVIGAGQMGNGITQVFATQGVQVLMLDKAAEFVARGQDTINKSLAKFVAKGTLTQGHADQTLSRISTAIDMNQLHDFAPQLVVEAVLEDFELKEQIFRQLDQLTPANTILASNTSSISITKIAATTKRPDKVIGMHFMNPVPLMQLVEVIKGIATSSETFQQVMQAAQEIGKTPVAVNDYPGFVSNRILMPMINEAIYTLMEGVAEREAIDTIMKLGTNQPMGPLTLADFIGLDTCLHIMEVLYEGFSDSKYRPCPLLRNMVTAGLLGRKSGQGFYKY
jgi:3-hydroxybutyryl-CoA dehydrogenase